MLVVKNLIKQYHGRPVVDNLSFSVAKGEVLVLLGTSGSGKSTTLRLINRLIEKDAGKIMVDGEDIEASAPYMLRRKIGYVIQNIGLFPHHTVAQNIGTVPKLLSWSHHRINTKVTDLLRQVNLPLTLADSMPHELSGGQQQRVGIARALAADPSLMLMDEPFGALDPITRHQLQTEFTQWKKQLNKAIVLVTHDVVEAFQLGDNICLLDQGRVQQLGKPKDLLFKPANSFVTTFFDQHREQLDLHVIKLFNLCPYIESAMDSQGLLVNADITIAECMAIRADLFQFTYQEQTYSLLRDEVLSVYYANRSSIKRQLNGTA